MCWHCQLNLTTSKTGCISGDRGSRVKDVLSHLYQLVSEKRASELLHSMVASQDTFVWTSHGQLLRNKRIIPVTNIADPVECVLLPHKNDVTMPRALNTFVDELAELVVDKGFQEQKVAKPFDRKGKQVTKMQKILPITRVIMRRVHRILKIRRAGGGEEEGEVASENDSDLEDEGTQESENDTEYSKCVRDINHEMP